MLIERTSMFSGKTHMMDLAVTQEQLDRWHNGELIQEVFPHLNPDEREFLMTGVTPSEWEEFADCDDDEDDDDYE